MKILTFYWILLSVFVARGAETSNNVPSTGQAPDQKDASFSIVERGANDRVWQKTSYEVAPNGTRRPHTHKYTELATGLHYKNEQGEWVESQEIIEPTSTGAAAIHGTHQVFFPADIYQQEFLTVTSDKKRLKSSPVAIYYYDGVHSVLLGQLTNSIGQILPSQNQVIYTNAFAGVVADVLCTYRKNGFESDVVLRGQLPDPVQLGLNPATTRVQCFTEFFDSPEPSQQTAKASYKDGLADARLNFGNMKMVPGKAFLVGDTTGETPQIATQHV